MKGGRTVPKPGEEEFFMLEMCLDTRELEAAHRQHPDLCKLISAKSVTLHTILLGAVGLVILSAPFTSSN
eukprot:332802-Pelagomonas_calceolata.AAC.1